MHDAKYLKLGRAAKEGTELAVIKTAIAGAEAAWENANRALNTARKTLKVMPVDVTPEIVTLNTELSTGEAGLKTAQGILEVAHGANKGVEVTVKAIGSGLTALQIKKRSAIDSLTGIASLKNEFNRLVEGIGEKS